jgi:hypothetical protein
VFDPWLNSFVRARFSASLSIYLHFAFFILQFAFCIAPCSEVPFPLIQQAALGLLRSTGRRRPTTV